MDWLFILGFAALSVVSANFFILLLLVFSNWKKPSKTKEKIIGVQYAASAVLFVLLAIVQMKLAADPVGLIALAPVAACIICAWFYLKYKNK